MLGACRLGRTLSPSSRTGRTETDRADVRAGEGETVSASLVKDAAEARMALRIVDALEGDPLKRDEIKAKIGAARRARKPNDILRRLVEAGIVRYVTTKAGGLRWTIARDPEPGELDPPPPATYVAVVDPVTVSGNLEVRGIEFDDSGARRVQVRRVHRFPNGNVTARHLWGLSAADARQMAAVLCDMADDLEAL